MKSVCSLFGVICFLLLQSKAHSQQRFDLVAGGDDYNWGTIADIKQDPQGYIWLSTQLKGLQKYDGQRFISYMSDPRNSNSIAANRVPCIHIDSSGIIWAGTYGGGLDKFDPQQNKFIHFRHDPYERSSLANDTVFNVLRDHLGNLWVGTYGGLDLLDERTGKFSHYKNIPGDASSLSYNKIWFLYEDHQGVLWVGCGSPFFNIGENPDDGGLNRFDRATGKFQRYLHDPKDPSSISNNKVRALFEDSQGNFWIGAVGDGLQILDRNTGKFTHYYHDPLHPEKLSRPPLKTNPAGLDHITFIKEDHDGSIWIGTLLSGMNKYDPLTKKVSHFGLDISDNKIISAKDTATGFHDFAVWRALYSTDGLMWFATTNGNLYNINPVRKTTIPYYRISQPEANSFYYDAKKNILWIGTSKGLVRKDIGTQTERSWIHDPFNNNSICSDSITSIRADGNDNLWIATMNGLSKFDLRKETFVNYKHNDKNPASISSDSISCLLIDHAKNLWISAGNWSMDKLDPGTNTFAHYKYSPATSIQNSFPWASSLAEDRNNDIWIGAGNLIKLDHRDGKFYRYLANAFITVLHVDGSNDVWAASSGSLYHYDRKEDLFSPFVNPTTQSDIQQSLHILEDDQRNLWISTNDGIVRINDKRNEVRTYGKSYGVHQNAFTQADNFKGENGLLFMGDQNGYYAFFPEQMKDSGTGPVVNFSALKIGDKEISAMKGVLNEPLWQAKEVTLNYDQNTFSLDFFAFDYKTPGEIEYSSMLQNYDNNWHYTGADHRAYFFKVPPGKYIFKVKANNAEGNYSERSISIIISPPWWRTWWAYTVYAILFILGSFVVNRFIRNRIIEKEKAKTRERELAQAKEIEKAYNELKRTQSQLIQSEKMASLGELTAGIAHEIQNPLNFVNNFSDVNSELIDEAGQEIENGNITEVKAILNDIKDNEQKINHHGKRADAIVKGMLQHSRISSGQKELTDINALCDEYLRLAYHGFRAKDKSFSATTNTDFDSSIGMVNVVPQDIGRVILNLINNAFYAVDEKKKQSGVGYEPRVTVSTKRNHGKMEIKVSDNGNGIPKKIVDKIFQPFFTTKPTGQGTGLGLSLVYDIVKAHGGELKLETRENEGSEFIIQLPAV
jgi:signal transduction histidine kinase/ligand-binding sensor domain-containing protein